MGVDYSAVIAIGKEFDEKSEVVDFLVEHKIATEDEIDEADGLEEFLYNSDVIGGGLLNYYSGNYYYLGYDLSVRSPEDFRKSFESAMSDWNKLFPDVVPDIVKTVKVH